MDAATIIQEEIAKRDADLAAKQAQLALHLQI